MAEPFKAFHKVDLIYVASKTTSPCIIYLQTPWSQRLKLHCDIRRHWLWVVWYLITSILKFCPPKEIKYYFYLLRVSNYKFSYLGINVNTEKKENLFASLVSCKVVVINQYCMLFCKRVLTVASMLFTDYQKCSIKESIWILHCENDAYVI